MPIVKLYERASVIAKAVLCTERQEDLELAFVGEARGAFLCMQCFISEERDWVETRGCPGRQYHHRRLLENGMLTRASKLAFRWKH